VIDSYLDGSMLETLGQRARKLDKNLSKLRPEEAAVLVLLQTRLGREARQQRKSSGKRRAA
jgi:DNA topoisomerase I